MSFIGVICEENIEGFIVNTITEKLQIKKESLIFIKENNIENIKNIKFETIVIMRKFKENNTLKSIIKKALYIIINTDIINDLQLLEDVKATVVTYGFNTKATITASSVEDEEMLICLQRNLKPKNGKTLEPQEIRTPIYGNTNCTMAIIIIEIIYRNNQ